MAKQQKEKTHVITFAELCQTPEVKDKFREMMGEQKGIAFLNSAVNIVMKDFDLRQCEPNSVLNAVSAVASLDLMIEPNFGHAFIVAHKEKPAGTFFWITTAQFQIGYKGLIELGHRTRQFVNINAIEVRQDEFVKNNRLTGEIEFNWNQDQDARKKLPVIGYVAFFELSHGFKKSLYMTFNEMKEHGQKWSKQFRDKNGQWQKDFDGMGTKTVLKLLLDKFAPKSSDLQRAIQFDQAIIKDIDGNSLEYADNPNNQKKPSLEENNRIIERQRMVDHIQKATKIEVLEQIFEHIPDQEIRDLYDAKLKKLKTKKPRQTKQVEQTN